MFSSFDVQRLHHAYLLEGETDTIFSELLVFLEKQVGFKIQANPDLWLGKFDSLGIDQVRVIKDFQSRKAVTGEKKFLIIKTNFLTHEAQNSLLKVFEEPTQGTHLFLLVPSKNAILPTLLSRLLVVKFPRSGGGSSKGSDEKMGVFAEKWFKASLGERLEMIKIFLPKTRKDRADKIGVINFLNEIEVVLNEEFRKERGAVAKLSLATNISEWEFIFSEIRQCRSYLNDTASSAKMILEHLSQIVFIQK